MIEKFECEICGEDFFERSESERWMCRACEREQEAQGMAEVTIQALRDEMGFSGTFSQTVKLAVDRLRLAREGVDPYQAIGEQLAALEAISVALTEAGYSDLPGGGHQSPSKVTDAVRRALADLPKKA